jgi:hypothetical protein
LLSCSRCPVLFVLSWLSCPDRKKTHEHEITIAKIEEREKRARKIEEREKRARKIEERERKSAKFKAKKRARKRKREELPPGARKRKREALKKARDQLCSKPNKINKTKNSHGCFFQTGFSHSCLGQLSL